MKTVLPILALILASQAAFADECLDKRRAMLSHFNQNISGYAHSIKEYAYANVHEAEDVLESEQFRNLCAADQIKFKKIIYSTFRMILVDEDDDPIETDENEIIGTLVGTRTWLVSFPNEIYSSFINYWTKDKKLRIKLINYDGEEGIATYMTNQDMMTYGDQKYPSILKNLNTAYEINPMFYKNGQVGVLPTQIIPDYSSFLLRPSEMTSFNPNVFFVGYDDDEMNISFGLNSAFKDMYGKVNTSSSKLASPDVSGGGVYDENFDMVGLHYYNGVYSDTNKKEEYRKIFNVVDSIPNEIRKKIINWIRVDIEIDAQKTKMKKGKAPIKPTKGTKSKDY